MREKMTSKERFHAIVRHQSYDRPCVINPTSIATKHSMSIANAYFPKAHTDAEKMADLACVGHAHLGFDTISPYFSVQHEAAALGCEVDMGTPDRMPSVKSHPVQDPNDFSFPSDFIDRPPIQTVLKAISLCKKRYSSQAIIVGKVIGPWTLAYHLVGVEPFLLDTRLNPHKIHEYLQAFLPVSLAFAHAQIQAGIDCLTWADHATGQMIGPDDYARFLLPVHQQAMSHMRSWSGMNIPVILHTCGRTTDRLHLFAKTGFDLFHFESQNDPATCLRIVSDRMLLTGCVNNPDTLRAGTPADVHTQVTQIVDAGIRLISPECAIPTDVPNENLAAIVHAAKAYGKT